MQHSSYLADDGAGKGEVVLDRQVVLERIDALTTEGMTLQAELRTLSLDSTLRRVYDLEERAYAFEDHYLDFREEIDKSR
jgi:hypothetical protein